MNHLNLDAEIELEFDDDIDIELEPDTLAFDRRNVDVNGRMTVPDCNISKSSICPYFGREIPGGEALGLDPNRVYMLYRDPKELAAGASTFEAVPLMLHHVATTAYDPQKPLVAGVVSNVRWRAPYLVADICVWTADAIGVIESGAQQELSCGYGYRADMTPGSVNGEHFDGRMVSIVGNHVALVQEGRVGPEAYVRE
jgi:hypothetical protein